MRSHERGLQPAEFSGQTSACVSELARGLVLVVSFWGTGRADQRNPGRQDRTQIDSKTRGKVEQTSQYASWRI